MKKYAVWTLSCFFLMAMNAIPKFIGGAFYSMYQSLFEATLIVIITDKFTDWVFKDRGKDNEHD